MVARPRAPLRTRLRGAVFAAGLGFCACGHAPPDWVAAGSRVSSEGSRQAVYAVGSARGVQNPALAWAVAENRARQKALTRGRHRFYGKVAKGTRRQVRIVDRWQAADGEVFALAVYAP